MSTPISHQQYWRSQRTRIVCLLVVWAIVAFGLSIFGVEALNHVSLAGIPLGFWMAQQGSIYIFVLLILIYALTSDRAERAAGLNETAATTSQSAEEH